MFAYLKGTLTYFSHQYIFLEVQGVGYQIFIAPSTFEKLPQQNHEMKIFISPVIREDSHKFYGFMTLDEKNFFETLCDISGIGPRLSLAILGHMTLDDLYLAVEHHNAKALSQIPGIGKKMAERLILELKDKLQRVGKEKKLSSPPQGPLSDAISALIHLGYQPMEAQKAVQSVLDEKEEEPPLTEIISFALKAKKR